MYTIRFIKNKILILKLTLFIWSDLLYKSNANSAFSQWNHYNRSGIYVQYVYILTHKEIILQIYKLCSWNFQRKTLCIIFVKNLHQLVN